MGGFPSGQRGQTVNLLSTTSVVRIHHLPPRDRVSKDALFLFWAEVLPQKTPQSCREEPLSHSVTAPLSGEPNLASPERGGGPRQRWRGRIPNLCQPHKKGSPHGLPFPQNMFILLGAGMICVGCHPKLFCSLPFAQIAHGLRRDVEKRGDVLFLDLIHQPWIGAFHPAVSRCRAVS